MIDLLNEGQTKRRYEIRNIDYAASGYLRINGYFDVEINPSVIHSMDTASCYLWCVHKEPSGYVSSREIAMVQSIPFGRIDDVVSGWAKSVKNHDTFEGMLSHLDAGDVLAMCTAPYKPGLSKKS